MTQVAKIQVTYEVELSELVWKLDKPARDLEIMWDLFRKTHKDKVFEIEVLELGPTTLERMAAEKAKA